MDAQQTAFNNLRNFGYDEIEKEVADKFTLVEYIWTDSTSTKIRGKTKVVQGQIKSVEDLDWWTYDGSSTGQAVTNDSEIWIKPVVLFKDPFRKPNGLIAICENFNSDRKTPALGNFRTLAAQIFNDSKHEDPWFGIEQEYFIKVRDGTLNSWPLGFPSNGFPKPQGQYYCSVGDQNAFGRPLAEAHIRMCLYAGVKLAGLNAEVAPGQWEYQVGITKGIECGDHFLMAQYILDRLGECYGVSLDYEPKPVKGDWNGSGCHTNYSTNSTRAEGGLENIRKVHMKALEEHHKDHILVYGEDNHHRLTGLHETSSMEKFSCGEGARGASIRIPVMTLEQGKGYYEDRRPASNINAYLVSAMIADTTILSSKYNSEILNQYKNFVNKQSN